MFAIFQKLFQGEISKLETKGFYQTFFENTYRKFLRRTIPNILFTISFSVLFSKTRTKGSYKTFSLVYLSDWIKCESRTLTENSVVWKFLCRTILNLVFTFSFVVLFGKTRNDFPGGSFLSSNLSIAPRRRFLTDYYLAMNNSPSSSCSFGRRFRSTVERLQCHEDVLRVDERHWHDGRMCAPAATHLRTRVEGSKNTRPPRVHLKLHRRSLYLYGERMADVDRQFHDATRRGIPYSRSCYRIGAPRFSGSLIFRSSLVSRASGVIDASIDR